ncbi:MAG TPA: glycosyltransferase family 2 protein [Paludibacter sp.]|nr:glycosyltransferase family 2 protein [Paludibacter sp.]
MNENNEPCLISIFMPVYNGSKYLKKSIDSVLKQTFIDFELVCVDDSSTDNSYEILIEFSKLDSRVKVYQKPYGGNAPKSWNYILPFLIGESITYMSQDDLISEDYLEQMFKKQQETNADCVLSDMIYYYEDREDNEILSGVGGNRNIILTNREAVILSLEWQIHSFGLWKSTIFKNVHFYEDSFSSDEFEVRRSFFKCNKIVFSKGVFYYRQDNTDAITKTFGIKNYSTILTTFRVYKFLEDNNFDSKVMNDYLKNLYRNYFNLYRSYCLKKAITTENELINVRCLFWDVFKLLDKRNLFKIKFYDKSTTLDKKVKRWIKGRIVFFLFFNYFIFKRIMYFIYLYDKSNSNSKMKMKIKSIFNDFQF